MKKMFFVLIAAASAIGFSAFTPTPKATFDTIDYLHNGVWQTFTGDPCPGDDIDECFKLTPHGSKRLYYNKNLSTPVYRDLP